VNYISSFDWNFWCGYFNSNWEYILYLFAYVVFIYLLRILTFNILRYKEKNNHYSCINPKCNSSGFIRHVQYFFANNSQYKTRRHPHQNVPPIMADSSDIKGYITTNNYDKKDNSSHHDPNSSIAKESPSTKRESNHYSSTLVLLFQAYSR
jgi:hypothetical protein